MVIERFLAILPFGVGWFHAKERAMSLINQHMGHTMFDATPLETHYGRTIALADFAAFHWQPLRRAFSRPHLIGEESKGLRCSPFARFSYLYPNGTCRRPQRNSLR
ncbi:hypothetical protein D1006_41350 [Burkholderia stabilis]|uniref:Uncharacterized protein n=1 Tax=Burkholderia stabilis TaxID=95485 RepID=A0A4Q2A6L2_9BURK|nr:hypothetical protein D1006_41350 [Burkholderia stabilis]